MTGFIRTRSWMCHSMGMGVAVTVVLMVIAFSALGALYVGIDRLMQRRARGVRAFRSG